MSTRWIGVLALLASASGAWAAALSNLQGTLGAALSAPGSTADAASVDGTSSIVLYATGTLGTASFQCEHSGDGTTFFAIDSAKSALGPVCVVQNPVGFYRVTATVCNTGCSLTFRYRATNRR
jgi:hypothetical protein